MIYFTGIGAPRDPQEALKWCSLASRQNLPLGMFYLGMAYSAGDGIPKNNDFSNRWIGSAAERGLMMAQLTLGMKLALGVGLGAWSLLSCFCQSIADLVLMPFCPFAVV